MPILTSNHRFPGSVHHAMTPQRHHVISHSGDIALVSLGNSNGCNGCCSRLPAAVLSEANFSVNETWWWCLQTRLWTASSDASYPNALSAENVPIDDSTHLLLWPLGALWFKDPYGVPPTQWTDLHPKQCRFSRSLLWNSYHKQSAMYEQRQLIELCRGCFLCVSHYYMVIFTTNCQSRRPQHWSAKFLWSTPHVTAHATMAWCLMSLGMCSSQNWLQCLEPMCP